MATSDVKCDSCDWKRRVPLTEMENWYKCTCPKCGAILLKFSDLLIIKMLKLFVKSGLLKIPDVEEDGNIRINTASDSNFLTIRKQ